MKNQQDLRDLLSSIDGRSYSAYKDIRGRYSFGNFDISVDRVQSDPYAPPSRVRVIIGRNTAGIPDQWLDSKAKRIAVADFLNRGFSNSIWKNADTLGAKHNGTISIDKCGQEILERTSVVINAKEIEARFEVGLPAAGRRALGRTASNIFCKIIPALVRSSLIYKNLNDGNMKRQILLMLDQNYIREELKKKNLVAFVGNDSILPRKSGVSDQPMKDGVPFKSPDTHLITFDLPSGKTVSGMGIKEGITLIVGGGYHGKSTILKALERGVYNHIYGDGREYVITIPSSMKIRAEDGRSVEKVNISPFINNLPGGKDTKTFSTENASGSTSQAANVVEALEAGSKLLLIDEDTSATNFMIRDGRMQRLVSKDKEPITPFIDKVVSLYEDLNVSTILIVGGSGDYFDVAERVIMMDQYIPVDVTLEAKRIAAADSSRFTRDATDQNSFGEISNRVPLISSFPESGKRDRMKPKGKNSILYGHQNIDISFIEQIVNSSQTNAISKMLDFCREELMDELLSISQIANKVYDLIESKGLDSIFSNSAPVGNLALPRREDFCAALNRYRGLKVK